jgi:agmatinase
VGYGTPTFALPADRFLGINRCEGVPYTIVGIPYDLGTSNRPGARFGPEHIRRASRMLVDGVNPYHGIDPKTQISDIGDFSIVQGDMMGTLTAIKEQAANYDHLITLGGDHSISLPLLQALQRRYGPVGLLHFDAHLDTWEDNFGGIRYGHGNPFFHAIKEGLIDTNRMVQVGIRSPVDQKTTEWTQKHGSHIITAFDVHSSMSIFECVYRIANILGDKPVYLTLDIDVLDPAFAPGTGTPEIGGLQSWQLQAILRLMPKRVNFIGMDLVEVAPIYDHAEITSLAAATMIWEYISRLVKDHDI